MQIGVNGQVLNVTNFLEDHPGGAKGASLPPLLGAPARAHAHSAQPWVRDRTDTFPRSSWNPDPPACSSLSRRSCARPRPALLLYAGKEASEEFNMLHDPK